MIGSDDIVNLAVIATAILLLMVVSVVWMFDTRFEEGERCEIKEVEDSIKK